MSAQILVVTTNEVTGYRVQATLGEVFGLTVRSRNVFSDVGASFKGIVGGEVKGYTKMLSHSREEAVSRLREAAAARGANAVLAMRFDCNEIMSNMSEVAAYGTAVTLVPDAQA